MILNPNCSDLVVSLEGVVKDEKTLRAVLREIERITGWRVGVDLKEWSFERRILSPVNIDSIRLNREVVGVEPRSLPDKLKAFLVEEELSGYLGLNMGNGLVDLELIPIKRFTHVEGKDNVFGVVDGINIYRSCSYCDRGPVLKASQHCYTSHFKPLAQVARRFNARWHVEDGGSSEDFDTWCRENGFKDVAQNGPW